MMLVVCAAVSSLVLLSVTVQVYSRPDGAPIAACPTLIPGHNNANNDVSNAENLPGGFYIYSDLFDRSGTYMADTNYEGNYAHVTYANKQIKK